MLLSNKNEAKKKIFFCDKRLTIGQNVVEYNHNQKGNMTIIANEIPQISQAFTRIKSPIEWVKPFNAKRDNEWELVVNGNTVKAVGVDVFINGKKLSFSEMLDINTLTKN